MTDADRLRGYLSLLGLTQRGLARALDLPERTIRHMAAGQEPVPPALWAALDGFVCRAGLCQPAPRATPAP